MAQRDVPQPIVSEYAVVRVRCEAPAPESVRAVSEDGKCNYVLGDVPGPVRFVGCSATAPSKPGSLIWLKCPRKDCRTWNGFAAVKLRD